MYAALAIAALVVLAIGGSSALDGPIVTHVSNEHGLHRGDFLAIGIGAVALAAVGGLVRASSRPNRDRPSSEKWRESALR